METEADILIDGLGGTSAVAVMTDTPVSTVHSWRGKPLSRSRLNHLRLAAKDKGIPWPIPDECDGSADCATGKIDEIPPAGVAA